MIVSTAFAGRHYAVLGLARSGRATVAALTASGAQVTAWDGDAEARAGVDGADGVTMADPLTIDLEGLAGVVVSPGVPLNRHPIAAHASAAGVPVIGDIELFAQSRDTLPPHRVVGVTGTNGKSTTTALIHHILVGAGVPATMGGNIGLPIMGQAPLAAGGVYVLELSSYQLDLTQSLACEVAILLNITPDHLDRYADFDAYAASKARLFAMQRPGGVAIVDYVSLTDRDVLGSADTLEVVNLDTVAIGDQAHWPALQGPHNAQNAAAASAACAALGVAADAIEAGMRSFPGLPHRMERVAEVNGVAWINDSKATNPDSAAPALAAFARIHWIVGGRAKGADLDACAPWFGHVARAYTIGEAGPAIAAILDGQVPVSEVGTIEDAVRAAAANAQPGDTVLLSPACASFDQFRDFEARGQAFRRAVEAL